MSANNSISARTQRLNKLIVCCSDESNVVGTHSAAVTTGTAAAAATNGGQSLNRETLLDAFDVLYNECSKDALRKNDRNIGDFSKKYQNVVHETKKLRVNINDFRIKDLIGKGHYGEVHLAIENVTNDVYAIKKIPKISYAQSKERNIMAISQSDWIPALQYAFQDQTNLYLVMEYLPGGDLFSLMIRNNRFSEDVIQFYLAEITLALNALHTLGFVHRDIKPENILLDRLGHLKLADFGSAVALEKDGHVTSFTPVGTPDYIAPELLQPIHSKRPMRTTYNETCDFWSMGIIAYEMLTETTPFHNNGNVHDTYSEILAYIDGKGTDKLTYPSDVEISSELRDLIDRLVTKMSNRFTYKKIITHRFFKSVDWMSLRQQVPPIIPTLNGDDDTSNFEEDLKKSRRNNTFDATPSSSSSAAASSSSMKNAHFSGFDLPFVGFGYVHDSLEPAVIFGGGEKSGTSEVGRLTTQVKSLQKTIDTQMLDISSLQQNLSEYQKKSAQVTSVEKILAVTREEMHTLKEKLKDKTVEIAHCRTQIKTLKNSLKIEEEQRAKNDANISDVLNSTYQKWERAKKLSEQNYEKQISEKKSEVISLQEKLKLCEKELESKSAECAHLQDTIDNFKDRLKSSKCQSDTEINAYARKHRESNVHFEGQLRELRGKLQKQIDGKHAADDEVQRMKQMIEETNHKLKLIGDQKERLDSANSDLMRQLNNEFDENRNLRDEKHKMSQKIMDLQNKIDDLSNDVHQQQQQQQQQQRGHRISITSGSGTDSLEGAQSVYCSLESINSEVENQLKKDLVLAKESEHEQRIRANNLEEMVKRLEAVIERVSKQGISGVEEMLERQHEKFEEKLAAAQERGTEIQRVRSTSLELYKLQKEFDTVQAERQRLEREIKRNLTEKDELALKVKENQITARTREERIAELQKDLAALKSEIKIERSRWETVEKERNKEKAQIVNQNTKIHKLEIDLDECRSKMSMFEQQRNALTMENKQLTQKLRKETEELDDTLDKLVKCEQNYETLQKNHEMLKSVCALMETQLTELEEMYNTQLEQNKEKSATTDKLWDDIRDRDAKLLKLQQEMADEKSHKKMATQKSTEMSTELTKLADELGDCKEHMLALQQDLGEKMECLIKAEEMIEVQREEIQSLKHANQSLNREIHIVKEEHSKLLTELYMSKENYQKLHFEYSALNEQHSDLRKELEQLNGTLCEINQYHTQREIKFEATQSQYKKLIDYLQKRVDELSQKKKKTLAEVLFGANTGGSSNSNSGANSSSKKENVPPLISQIQRELDANQRSRASQRSQSSKVTKSQSSATKKSSGDKSTSTPRDKSNSRAHSNWLRETPSKEATSGSTSSSSSVSSDTHQFERVSYSNGSGMSDQCIVCKKRFVSDTVYQCKKCQSCVHQYCRGSNLKCLAGSAAAATSSSDTTSNTDTVSLLAAQPKPQYTGDVVLKETDSTPMIKVYCMHEIDTDVLLLGCDSGLKSFNVSTRKMIHIANINTVVDIAIAPAFPKSILISENGMQLLQCDLEHLKTRAKASVCLNTGLDYLTLDLPFVQPTPLNTDCWRFVKIFDNNERAQEIKPIAIAATHTQIVILQYDVENKHFKAIRSLDTATPVKSVYFTPYTAIVSSDKFFEIDLDTLVSEEFLDSSDKSLLHTLKSKPFNTFSINSQEYLMCFNDCGIFVNEFGCRTRPTELKWSNSPNGFVYRAPLLYIFSEAGIQLMRIHKSYTNELNYDETDDDNEADGAGAANGQPRLQKFIDMKYTEFGGNCEKYGIYTLSKCETGGKQIVRIDGIKVLRASDRFDSMETILSDNIGF